MKLQVVSFQNENENLMNSWISGSVSANIAVWFALKFFFFQSNCKNLKKQNPAHVV